MHPTLKAEIFALLEAKILARASNAPVAPAWTCGKSWCCRCRLGLDADWDRMEHIANYDTLVRQMLGVCWPRRGEERQSIRPSDPCGTMSRCLDEELRPQINARIAAAGREVFAKRRRARRGAEVQVTPTCWKPTAFSDRSEPALGRGPQVCGFGGRAAELRSQAAGLTQVQGLGGVNSRPANARPATSFIEAGPTRKRA